MPLIQVLSYLQKKEFETPPQLNDEMRREIFALPSLLSQQLYSIDLADNRVKGTSKNHLYSSLNLPIRFF